MKKYIFIIFCISNIYLYALDEIRYESGQGKNDPRMKYKLEVLEEALKQTFDEYGEYIITTNAPKINSIRARKMLQTGKSINVFIALTNHEWEKETIPIRIPIRRGILSYRLLLINKNDLDTFSEIKTAEDLREKTVGLGIAWAATETMGKLGFDITEVPYYESLFYMLNKHRIDFIPRGLNEVFKEYELFKGSLPNLIVEPNLVIKIPTPTYIFVSPWYPRLAKRLEEGLELMVANGSLEKIFNKHFAEDIMKANIKNRHIIDLGNPVLPNTVPFNRDELWFDINKY